MITFFHQKITKFLYEPSRIIAVLVSAPANGVGHSLHERVFVTVCFLWSLNLTGAFQVRIHTTTPYLKRND